MSAVTWVPDSCTLPTVQQPLRVAEFDDLFATAVRPAQRLSPTRLRLHLAGGADIAASARDLVARETGCCSFFTFDLQTSAAETVLEVQVPESHVAVLDAVQQRADATRSEQPS